MSGKARALLAVALAAGAPGCVAEAPSLACTAVARAGLSVTVRNAATGGSICDATVVATDGGYSETLFPSACTSLGAFERPGTYVVRVERAGFGAGQVGPVVVTMGGGSCPHVQEVALTVSLTPAGQAE